MVIIGWSVNVPSYVNVLRLPDKCDETAINYTSATNHTKSGSRIIRTLYAVWIGKVPWGTSLVKVYHVYNQSIK